MLIEEEGEALPQEQNLGLLPLFNRNIRPFLLPDDRGQYYRQWREHISDPGDIWQEIVAVANLPGVTSAPRLQPNETRLIMLQTGMRAPMGIKVYGPDLKTIEAVETFGTERDLLYRQHCPMAASDQGAY